MKWTVKIICGKLRGTKLAEFDNPADADEWLCAYCKVNGCSIVDFTISVSE